MSKYKVRIMVWLTVEASDCQIAERLGRKIAEERIRTPEMDPYEFQVGKPYSKEDWKQ